MHILDFCMHTLKIIITFYKEFFMNITKKQLIFCILFSQVMIEGTHPLKSDTDFKFQDRAAWRAACAKLPMNIDAHNNSQSAIQSAFMYHAEIGNDKKLAWEEFDRASNKFLDLKIKKLNNAASWTDSKAPDNAFFDTSKPVFMPYAEKVELQADDQVVFHGDFHGDIHSLQAELDQLEARGILKKGSFELADKNVHLTFLGDYVDRGDYGAEVIYSIIRLQLANPDNVIMVRGNHEDKALLNRYGFRDELIAKFGSDEGKYEKNYRMYNFLPIVAYIGHHNDYLQCCHGGLEHGYNQQKLLNGKGKYDLIGKLKRGDFKKYLDNHHEHHDGCCGSWQNDPAAFRDFTPTSPIGKDGSVGQMWADFKKTGQASMSRGRGLAANEDLTQAILDYQNEGSEKKVRGIFRAHQHTGSITPQDPKNLMYELIASNGVYKLWRPIEADKIRSLVDGLVWTFNVAPDSGMTASLGRKNKGYGFDAYAILTIKEKYQDWKLQVHNPLIIDRPGFKKPNSGER